MEWKLHVGGVYRHFKGNTYRVLALARHSETLELLVVYQQLYGAHPYRRFFEEPPVVLFYRSSASCSGCRSSAGVPV